MRNVLKITSINILCVLNIFLAINLSVKRADAVVEDIIEMSAGTKQIKVWDEERLKKWNENKKNEALDDTKSIYRFLEKTDTISDIHFDKNEERKTIFKAIMASIILHKPESGDDFHCYLDFCENSNSFDGLTLDKKKHLQIIRDLNRFSKAVVKGYVTDGHFNFLQSVIENSGVKVDDFFKWFLDVITEFACNLSLKTEDGCEISNLADLEKKYTNHVLRESQACPIKYRPVNASDRYSNSYLNWL
jgi:hypothetical protein